ncbi:hypothetical protein FS592_21155 [Serratia plymuthica]|nr:hypothetical protein FS592_21155 [Serratia plymuthica]
MSFSFLNPLNNLWDYTCNFRGCTRGWRDLPMLSARCRYRWAQPPASRSTGSACTAGYPRLD